MVQLEEEKRKGEDLLFRFEEESVNKDDIQVRVSTVPHKRLSNTINIVKIYSEHRMAGKYIYLRVCGIRLYSERKSHGT